MTRRRFLGASAALLSLGLAGYGRGGKKPTPTPVPSGSPLGYQMGYTHGY